MKAEIKSITPVRPNDVGDLRFEFRVVLAFGEQEQLIDVTAEQLTDFRQFQQVALAKSGCLPNLGLTEANSEFEAFRRWQTVLENAEWVRESHPSFDSLANRASEDDESEPFYGFAKDE